MQKIFIFLLLTFTLLKAADDFYMPHETILHERTWMGFPEDPTKWVNILPEVQKNIALIAKTISKYEPVNMIVSSEKSKKFVESLLSETQIQSNYEISLVVQPINDLWLRDTGSVFVFNQSNQQLSGIDFNFNGWGEKEDFELDQEVAKFITDFTKVPRVPTELTLESGCIDVDGEGTVIIAESCILNDNRNPGWTKDKVEKEFAHLIGGKKFIWVPGVKDQDITDGHIDFYARFVGKSKPGHVFVHMDESDPSTKQNLEIIQNSTDAKGRKLTPIILKAPNVNKIRKTISSSADSVVGYVNMYLLNNAVLVANYGDKEADENARKILQESFPDRTVEMISIDHLLHGGGSVHCSTQQQYARIVESTTSSNIIAIVWMLFLINLLF